MFEGDYCLDAVLPRPDSIPFNVVAPYLAQQFGIGPDKVLVFEFVGLAIEAVLFRERVKVELAMKRSPLRKSEVSRHQVPSEPFKVDDSERIPFSSPLNNLVVGGLLQDSEQISDESVDACSLQ